MSATSTGHSKSKTQKTGLLLIILGVPLIIGMATFFLYAPSYWLEWLHLETVLMGEHEANAAQMADETKDVGAAAVQRKRVSSKESLFAALMPSANRAAMLDTTKDAWLSRTTRRIPLYHQPVVEGNQGQWENHFTASEPLLVRISRNDKVCTGNFPDQCAQADGILRDDSPYKYNKTVLQDPDQGGNPNNKSGGYRAVIIRICQNGGCSYAEETGFLFAACPANNRSTEIQLWTNAYSIVGPLRHNEDFTTAKGRFTYEVIPDDPSATAACSANPNYGFVRLVESPHTKTN